MKKNKQKLIIGLSLTSLMAYSQVPTGAPPTPFPASNPNQAVNLSNNAWYRGGNTNFNNSNNIFGTVWNSPVYHYTANQFRMIVNGDKNTLTTVAAGSQNTSGFIGINVQNPLSRLHLGGPTLSLYGGYRPWMREGFTIQNADDQMWFGLKRWGASSDQQNAVINWGDDAAGAAGPDHLVFNFSGSSFSNPYNIPGINPSAATLDGLEVMRITDVGRVGIGPRFSNTFIPQSTLHQHQENAVSSWMQITNQGTGNVASATAPTAITANDGLRWGILGNQNLNDNGNAFIYNQENRHLIFSTNNVVPTDMSATNERMRITHIGAPGTPNPGALAQNSTRVSISHNPAAPITNPLSLLHLGYNSGLANNDGWRSWMDVGMYVAQSSDNVFLGLKNESTNPLGDKFDAVLSWGDNQINSNLPPNNGPDNFRFIFTSTTAGSAGGTNPANTLNGLEGMRLTPTPANGVFTGVGGAPTVNPYSTGINPGNTMEINSWGATNVVGGSSGLRFTNLNSTTPTLANPGTGVLSVNAQGDVIYVPGGAVPTSNNGISINGGVVQLGVPCTTPLAGIAANALTTDRVIANGNQNLWIASLNTQTGGFGVGGQPASVGFCGTGNTMEISANLKSVKYGNNNASGLRFSKLLSTSPTVPNGTNGVNSLKVLTVDDEGDVVLTDAAASANADNGLSTNGPTAGFIHLGQDVGTAGNPGRLLNNREIPMSKKNIYFTGIDSIGGIGIGLPGNTLLDGSLHVQTIDSTKKAGVVSNFFTFDGGNPNNSFTRSGDFRNFGLTPADGSIIGVLGLAQRVVANPGGSAIGVYGISAGTGYTNFGGIFSASDGTNQNIGVYATADGSSTGLPASPTQQNLAGYFNGDVYISGSFGPSDQILKENIDSISNALSIINQLKPKTYTYKHSSFPSMHLAQGLQYGLIAQDVEQVIPELVSLNTQPAKLDSLGNVVVPAVNFKGLEYQQLIPILIKAIQEQQKTIDSLSTKQTKQDSINNAVQAQLAALASQLNGCCTNAAAKVNQAPSQTQKTIHQLEVELSDKDAIVLEQNVPNPFAEQTTILYNIPTSVGKAQILFYNSAGQIIKSVDVSNRGNGKLIVFANDLSSGLYHYTLVADGKVVDSKKMVRE